MKLGDLTAMLMFIDSAQLGAWDLQCASYVLLLESRLEPHLTAVLIFIYSAQLGAWGAQARLARLLLLE